MSACISQRGEYSIHELDDAYTCTWCGVLDEDALIAELREVRAELARRDAALADLTRQRDALREHILDIDAHATPYGDIPDEPGFVGTYLVTAGALHRALGKIGHTAPSCSAEAELAEARHTYGPILTEATNEVQFWRPRAEAYDRVREDILTLAQHCKTYVDGDVYLAATRVLHALTSKAALAALGPVDPEATDGA